MEGLVKLWTYFWTQIRLNTIMTLATKHLMVINKDNLYLQLKVF